MIFKRGIVFKKIYIPDKFTGSHLKLTESPDLQI